MKKALQLLSSRCKNMCGCVKTVDLNRLTDRVLFKRLMALPCIILVIVAWLAMAELVQDIQHEYAKPFLLTYVAHSAYILTLFPWIVWRGIMTLQRPEGEGRGKRSGAERRRSEMARIMNINAIRNKDVYLNKYEGRGRGERWEENDTIEMSRGVEMYEGEIKELDNLEGKRKVGEDKMEDEFVMIETSNDHKSVEHDMSSETIQLSVYGARLCDDNDNGNDEEEDGGGGEGRGEKGMEEIDITETMSVSKNRENKKYNNYANNNIHRHSANHPHIDIPIYPLTHLSNHISTRPSTHRSHKMKSDFYLGYFNWCYYFGVSIPISIIAFISGWLWYLSLPITSVSGNTAIYQSSCTMVYIFSILILKEEGSKLKTCSVILSVMGVLCVSFGGGKTSEENGEAHSHPSFMGYVVCLLSMILYALFEVMYKRWAAHAADPRPLINACRY